MSSLRNAVKRVTHKERSQPVSRQHLGILEKKKDYKKRAIDYHRKEDRIKTMKEKAAMKNPDEFYFGMHNSQVQNGQHKSKNDIDGTTNRLPSDVIALMKNQDLSYVRMKKQSDLKKAERLQASLHMTAMTIPGSDNKKNNKRKHTIFVNDAKEAETFDVAEHFDTIPEFAGRSFNRLRKKDVEKFAKMKSGIANDDNNNNDDNDDNIRDVDYDYEPTRDELIKRAKLERQQAKKLVKARDASYKEMEARLNRVQAMQQAEDHLITEKLLAGKGRKRKIKGAEDGKPAQYKWRRKRLG